MTHYLVSVAIRDEPGALARVTRQLAAWHINLRGVVADSSGLRLLVDDHIPISRALNEAGFLHRVEDVQEVLLEDRPGALAELCMHLADAGINIKQAFGARGRVYLCVDDWEHAAPIVDLHTNGPTIVHPRLGRIA